MGNVVGMGWDKDWSNASPIESGFLLFPGSAMEEEAEPADATAVSKLELEGLIGCATSIPC